MSRKAGNHRLVTLMRELHKMTQQELAERIGAKHWEVSRIELGSVELSDDYILKMAVAFDVPPSFFHRDFDPRRVPLTLYRAKNMTQADAKALIAQHHYQLMALRNLMLAVKPLKRRYNQIDVEEYRGSVEGAAHDLRIQWNVLEGPVEDVCTLIERAGIVVIPTHFESDKIDGMSVYLDEVQPVIFVSNSIPADRFRWTLCHELAHIIFHLHVSMPGSKRDLDNEADRFAAAFLMPASEIRRQLAKPLTLEKLGQLKRHWKVAMSALITRSAELGQISPATRSNLYRRMNTFGMIRDEPNKFPREQPDLIRSLIDYHLTKLGYSINELMEITGMSLRGIQRYFPGVLKMPALKVMQ